MNAVNELRTKISSILRNKFAVSAFKHKQEQAITAAMLGYDTFVQMPTGGGKTLCFQIPALEDKGVTVVISPLLSLIRDQMFKMHGAGIPCATFDHMRMAREAITGRTPKYKVLYVTPEKAVKNSQLRRYLRYLYSKNLLARFVIDEAHCVNQWGHSFRPDFLHLGSVIQEFRKSPEKKVPILALTASASEEDCKKAIEYLGMECDRVLFFKSELDRPNLNYRIIPKSRANFLNAVSSFLSGPGSGIVYCLTENECQTTAKLIGSTARPYYSGLSARRKRRYQDKWMSGDIRILCATSAFGMGIDKPDVRCIIHRSMPRTLTEYSQETGRAGRDDNPAECVLLYRFEDQFRILREIEAINCTSDFKKNRMEELKAVVNYCEKYYRSEGSAISPNHFMRSPSTETILDKRSTFHALSIVNQKGRIGLNDLHDICAEKYPTAASIEYRTIVRRLILSGHLRIFLQFNTYMKCAPFLSLSPKGQRELDILNQVELASFEKQTLDVQLVNHHPEPENSVRLHAECSDVDDDFGDYANYEDEEAETEFQLAIFEKDCLNKQFTQLF